MTDNAQVEPTATDTPAAPHSAAADFIAEENRYSAPNYHPLPVVIAHAEGAWVTDVDGKRYLDLLSAYSALNFGHRHPALIAAMRDQLDHVTLTSRAAHNDLFGGFARELADVCGMNMVLPMNTGAEAVETAIKTSRKWGYDIKGVAPESARIIVCDGNFHGRTTTIVSFSDDDTARDGFAPFTPGFDSVPYGDSAALEAAITPNTVGFLFEPVQGEGGIIVPPPSYLREVREICTRHNVLMIADEIQTGFGRTGETFACDHEGVKPDMYVLGKALGGGIMPLSAVVADSSILGVMTPGTHGSTFGGNPLACAVGLAVLRLVRTGEFQRRSKELGEHLAARLRSESPAHVREIRSIGLWAGIEIDPAAGKARSYCSRLLERGIIVKDTHSTTMRVAPPLSISREDLDFAIDQIIEVLNEGPNE